MTFLEPLWLTLFIPLAAALWLWRPARSLVAIRIAILLCLLLALAGLAVKLQSRAGVVVLVADRSLSMPANADALERELATTLEDSRRSASQVGVVSFGEQARIEAMPGGARFSGFEMRSAQDASELHGALDTALSLIPRDAPGRIVVVSDGRWTGRDPSPLALQAAARGVAIDYRLASRGTAGDVAIERVDAPDSVSPGESFAVAAWLEAPHDTAVTVTLQRGASVIASGKQRLPGGTTRLAFRDRAPRGGTLAYKLTVTTAEPDPVAENNAARFLVGVDGPKPVLLVAGSRASRFASVLEAGGLVVETKTAPEWSLELLANYSAVVLENLPAEELGTGAMSMLASWVTESGGALMMTGGESAFASGGYFGSPLEPILPVSMELRREHRKLNMAIVVALDRSGSMSMPAGGGKVKMDLANAGAAQVLELLAPQDELGVVAVDSSSHIIADLDPIEGRKDLRSRILGIESMGGGIFVYEALATASRMLLTAKAQTRHIILFADAADAEEPGQYVALLEKCRKANITVTVIGLGEKTDVDAPLLRDIAARGGGRIFFTNNANELPRLFAQDTFIVARSTFVEEDTGLQTTPALYSLAGRPFNTLPSIGGYNLSYLRDGATPAVVTTDEYRAPVVASWHAGAGRVLVYTGEVDGAHSGALARWPEAGGFHASLVRWVAGTRSPLPDSMLATQRVENGVARIELELDPERAAAPLARMPRVTTLAATAGTAPVVTRHEMTWRTPDVLTVEIPLEGSATYLSTLELPGAGRVTLAPVALPYSPEAAPAAAGEGRKALERLARATGGRERVDVRAVWNDVPEQERHVPLRNWLVLTALVLLLVEVLERRTAILSAMALPKWVKLPALPAMRRRRAVKTAPRPTTPADEPPPAPAVQPPDALVDALRQAGKRASRKT
ncbi:MAG TPA: vWA domain-containing protein [Thermoanaerobaculia bacterium]|jgi:Mg-chelatase subunit ChlD